MVTSTFIHGASAARGSFFSFTVSKRSMDVPLMCISWSAFYCCDKYYDQKELTEKRVYFVLLYNPSFGGVSAGTQGRNQEAGTETN